MSRENKRGTWRTIRRLEKSIPQVRWYRTELVLMSLFVNVFALGLPIFILQVYDRVLPNLGLTTMQFLVIGLIAVMLLDFFLKTARASVTTYTGARFEHLARVSAVDHILRTPQDVYEKDTPGAYLDKVNAIGVVKDFYSSQLGTLLIDLPFAVFFLGMIWFLGGVIVAVPLVLLTLFGIMAIVVGGNLRKAVDVRSQVDNRRYDFLIEIINGIHTVKAQAFKNLLQRRFDPLQEMSARAVRSVAMQSSIAQSLGSTFGQLNMACVIGTGAILVIDGSLSAGELAACTLLSGRAMQPLQSAMGLWTNFQTIRVACDNAIAVLELPAEDMSHLPEMPAVKGDLELKDVTFGYEGMEDPLINNLNLKVKAGEMIGVEGDNSSGRSTLLKLMIGMIRPNSGEVLLDGQDLAQFRSKSYRRQMAFLTADSDVYSGTILDNMTYFRGGKYISKAIRIARQLGLDEEIKRLPEGYGTHVGDGAGGVLPAGFVQRITVVRAMIDDPKVVLFDNANHGLDSNSDKTLMEYIDSLRGKTTVILVTSRPSWLRMADRRYMMSHGYLEERPQEAPPQLSKPAPALPAPEEKPMPEQKAPAPEQASATPNAPQQPSTQPAQQPAQKPPQQPSTQPAQKPAQQPADAAKTTPSPATQDATKPAPQPSATPRRAPVATPRPKTPRENTQQDNKQQTAKAAKPDAGASTTPPPAARPAPQAKPQPKAEAPAQKQAPRPAAAPAQAAKPAPTPAPRSTQKPTQAAAPAQRNEQAAANRPVAPRSPAAPAQKSATPAPQQPAAKTAPAAAAKPAAKPVAKPAPKPAPKPATQRQPAPAAKPAPRPAPKAAPRPAPKAAPKPATKPAPAPQAQAPSRAAAPRQPDTPQAASTPQAGTAVFSPAPETKKPAPKAAATLRAAPNAGRTNATRNRATLKPQPPKPRRTATFQPAAGGSE